VLVVSFRHGGSGVRGVVIAALRRHGIHSFPADVCPRKMTQYEQLLPRQTAVSRLLRCPPRSLEHQRECQRLQNHPGPARFCHGHGGTDGVLPRFCRSRTSVTRFG
jgi:hypothetical protein